MRGVALLVGVIAVAGMMIGMSPVMPDGDEKPGFEVRVTSSGLN